MESHTAQIDIHVMKGVSARSFARPQLVAGNCQRNMYKRRKIRPSPHRDRVARRLRSTSSDHYLYNELRL